MWCREGHLPSRWGITSFVSSPSPAVPREAPPSGVKVYAVLLALLALLALTCCALGLGYAFFLDAKSTR